MPSLMLVFAAVSEELKQTDRKTDRITLYIIDFLMNITRLLPNSICKARLLDIFSFILEVTCLS